MRIGFNVPEPNLSEAMRAKLVARIRKQCADAFLTFEKADSYSHLKVSPEPVTLSPADAQTRIAGVWA